MIFDEFLLAEFLPHLLRMAIVFVSDCLASQVTIKRFFSTVVAFRRSNRWSPSIRKERLPNAEGDVVCRLETVRLYA